MPFEIGRCAQKIELPNERKSVGISQGLVQQQLKKMPLISLQSSLQGEPPSCGPGAGVSCSDLARINGLGAGTGTAAGGGGGSVVPAVGPDGGRFVQGPNGRLVRLGGGNLAVGGGSLLGVGGGAANLGIGGVGGGSLGTGGVLGGKGFVRRRQRLFPRRRFFSAAKRSGKGGGLFSRPYRPYFRPRRGRKRPGWRRKRRRRKRKCRLEIVQK